MAILGITTENRVIVFMDVHNFSIAFKVLGENSHGFVQAMYEGLGTSSLPIRVRL
ncbi:MAG TPA: hypothetical protein PLH19_06830 [Anaerolineae bacterium]|nr:hypothetical protein [Anaerolineae bacterium]HQH38236.1 hypothetical protein [Anaerolineae bacterium]